MKKKTHLQQKRQAKPINQPNQITSMSSLEPLEEQNSQKFTVTEQQIDLMAEKETQEFWEIEYFSEDIYIGELQGDKRHGMGLFIYKKTGEKVMGYWKKNYLQYEDTKHPIEEITGDLVPLAVMKYSGKKKPSGNQD